MSDNQAPNAYSRTLSHSIEKLHLRRSEYLQSRIMSGKADPRTRARLEDAVLDMFHELRPYALDKTAIGKLWEEANLEELPDVCSRVEEVTDVRNSGGMVTKSSSTEIKHAPGDVLIEASRSMDRVAHELGFTVETKTARPRGRI